MCLNPIRVKNPKFKTGTFNKLVDPFYLRVPCGKCWQCRQRKQQEWILRNYIEYKECINNYGIVYFYTLTFDDEHLTKIGNVPCFDSEKVKKFNKRMHNRLFRCGCEYKYFVVSELGETYERPHHHALFYLKPSNNYKIVQKDGVKTKVKIKYNPPSALDFYDIVKSCWNFGLVKYGNNFGVVNSPFALYYVCKYLNKGGKEIKFFHVKDTPYYPNFIAAVNRRFGTFYRCSAGFGRNYISKLTLQDFNDGVLTIPVEKKILKIPIPEYFLRKTIKVPFINCNGNVSYKLNFKGFEYYSKRFDNMVMQIENRCKLLNEHFGTDFSSDFILHCQLDDSLPIKELDKGFKEIYFNRKYNNAFTNHCYSLSKLELVNRYYLSSLEVEKYRLFNKLNSKLSYYDYEKKQKSYNRKQLLLYGSKKKEVKILNYYEYVNFAPKLAICREGHKNDTSTLAANIRNYKYFKKFGLCRTRKRNSIVSIPAQNLP